MKKLDKRLSAILKVIDLFKERNSCYFIKKRVGKISKGKPLFEYEKIKIKLAVMVQSQKYFVRSTVANDNSFFKGLKEAYYTYDNDQIKEIQENDLIEIDNIIYRVDSTENNYNLFQRLELVENDKQGTRQDN